MCRAGRVQHRLCGEIDYDECGGPCDCCASTCLCCFVWPWELWLWIPDKKRDLEYKARARRMEIAESIAPLPTPRLRNLSPAPSGGPPPSRNPYAPILPKLYGQRAPRPAGKQDDQTSCLFFKLSPELRLMIYREVISDYNIIISKTGIPPKVNRRGKEKPMPSKLDHVKFIEDGNYPKKFSPTISALYSSTHSPNFSARIPSHRLLPLLQTCRRIYAETIDSLYSTNTFCFVNEKLFMGFHTQLLPKRLNSITSLYLHTKYNRFSFRGISKDAANIICSMAGLRRLDIFIQWPYSPRGLGDHLYLLKAYLDEPLRTIGRYGNPELVVTVRCQTEQMEEAVKGLGIDTIRLIPLGTSESSGEGTGDTHAGVGGSWFSDV
ncbi:hypothetical protein FQN55_008868 [Onygenales sp. PD_40]|nr:hypothetical protein FQN55_008868 [Onygenales sp. PD_40]